MPGDREPRLDQPLAGLIEAVVGQRLGALPSLPSRAMYSGAAFAVSAGYPRECPAEPPGRIRGLDDLDDDIELLGEAVRRSPSGLRPGNGRVVALVARGEDRSRVREKLIGNLERIHFNGMYWREDIACQSLFEPRPSETWGASCFGIS